MMNIVFHGFFESLSCIYLFTEPGFFFLLLFCLESEMASIIDFFILFGCPYLSTFTDKDLLRTGAKKHYLKIHNFVTNKDRKL